VPAAARALAEFALALAYDDIPAPVVERAKACMTDTVGAAAFGAALPWSRIVLDYARRNGASGDSTVIATDVRLRAPFAAMVNGAFAHAFELDSMCQPSVGAHPGAALTAPGLAVAEAHGNSGRELITAFVAGCEIMYRIGEAAHHSSERLGFHAPGLLGVFGGAVVAGRLLRLDAGRLANALGISGSLCAGLLEFSKSGGGMVKRLHQGRASESAVLAAELALDGFGGAPEVLEGRFGFLNTFCRDADVSRLTADLGSVWRTLTTTLKCYACHSTAHVAVTAALEIKEAHGITGGDIESIRVAGSEKLVSHHAITDPQDLAMAQYSAPFSVALAFYRDPRDPKVFCDASLSDPAIRALCRRVSLELYADGPRDNQLASRVTVRLKNGREIVQDTQYFPGMPQRPLSAGHLWNKFELLTASYAPARARQIFDRMGELEKVEDIRELELGKP
jgi:2-methylcitrate dehydratase PrpD